LKAPGITALSRFPRTGLGGVLAAAPRGGISAALPPVDAAMRGHAVMVSSFPMTVLLFAPIGASAWVSWPGGVPRRCDPEVQGAIDRSNTRKKL
jgi:hypothetical protein